MLTIQYGRYIQHHENEHYSISVCVEDILKQAYDSVLLYKALNEEPSDEVNNSTYSNPIPEGHDGEIWQ